MTEQTIDEAPLPTTPPPVHMTPSKEFVIGDVRPRFRVVKQMNCANSVRAYRDSPTSVQLQIRLEGRYVGVALSHEDAHQLGEHLIGEAGKCWR